MIRALLAFLVLVAPAASLAQTTEIGGVEVQIGGRVQTLFNTTTVDTEPTAEWLMRRVRLEAEVQVNELISAKVQPDFAGGELSLKDAYMMMSFDPGFGVLVGQAHRPFSLLEQTSSKRMPPIERGARIRGVEALEQYELVSGLEYSDRDIGLQLMGAPVGAPLGFEYAIGVFGGPLQGEVGGSDTYQLAGRVSVEPIGGVRVGAGWSRRDFLLPGPGAGTDSILRGGSAFEGDIEVGSFGSGLHLLAEVATGDLDPALGDDFFGAQGWGAYRFERAAGLLSMLEPTFRVSYGDAELHPGVAASDGTLLTPGLNIYLGGLNRVMMNYDFWTPDGRGDGAGSFKAMFQMVF